MIRPDTPLFDRMEVSEAESIIKYFVLKNFPRGSVIVEQGQPFDYLMVVLKGTVTAECQSSSGKKSEIFPPDTLFGETSLFTGESSLDRFYATENTVLLCIDKYNLQKLMNEQPRISNKLFTSVMHMAIKRLRTSSRFLADIVQWGEQASRRAITDEMTGIYNRTFLDDALENFFEISRSNSKPLSLFMMDIDHCREINEKLGLEAGNTIIIEVVKIIRNAIGGQGIITRYGGDEFCALLPEASSSQAYEAAEKIRSDVELFDFTAVLPQLETKITISIGISSYPENSLNIKDFKANADDALYRAKKKGRNIVVTTGVN